MKDYINSIRKKYGVLDKKHYPFCYSCHYEWWVTGLMLECEHCGMPFTELNFRSMQYSPRAQAFHHYYDITHLKFTRKEDATYTYMINMRFCEELAFK